MTLDASAQNNRIITLYEQHVNPGLVKLLKFMGLETTEYRGRGAIVEDTVGGKFIDCLGGFGSLNFGHAHPRIIEAVHKQLDLMPLSTKLLFNKPQGELAERLAEITPGDLQFSFFCHSGAEAVEGAIKFARLATGKRKIIAANDAYHGKTLGALSALVIAAAIWSVTGSLQTQVYGSGIMIHAGGIRQTRSTAAGRRPVRLRGGKNPRLVPIDHP